MTVSRRSVLLLGGLGVLGAGSLMVPTRSVDAKSASRLDDSEMPQPFRTAFAAAPVLRPRAVTTDPVDGAAVHHYVVTERAARAQILPRAGLTTPILGYDGIFPGPTISVDRGTRAVLRFVRPVCFQNFPDVLLPAALQEANPLGLWRLVDGETGRR